MTRAARILLASSALALAACGDDPVADATPDTGTDTVTETEAVQP